MSDFVAYICTVRHVHEIKSISSLNRTFSHSEVSLVCLVERDSSTSWYPIVKVIKLYVVSLGSSSVILAFVDLAVKSQKSQGSPNGYYRMHALLNVRNLNLQSYPHTDNLMGG